MSPRVALLALATVAGGAWPAPRADAPTVRWTPRAPRQGSVLQVAIRDGGAGVARVVAVEGRVGPTPLAFAPDSTGAFLALGGIAVDARGDVPLRLVVRRASGAVDSVTHAVRVTPGAFRMERLRVAPRFGRAPDSALTARMAREAAQARAVAERSLQTPRLWGGAFTRPRPGRITSGFGHGREFNGAVQSRHMGTDFASAPGAPVRAAACGVVALVADFYLAGNAVYVDHGGGLVTAYFHLSRATVAQGDTVRAGDVVGRVGATGRVTGPHLHWIARVGGTTVDPTTLLALPAPMLPAPAERCRG
jgi:murein DD-endopeptidase MepM/ murein hydrolase activator NlpD